MIKDLVLFFASGDEYERLWSKRAEEILREFFDSVKKEEREALKEEMIKELNSFEV